jgi:hypothetical protein
VIELPGPTLSVTNPIPNARQVFSNCSRTLGLNGLDGSGRAVVAPLTWGERLPPWLLPADGGPAPTLLLGADTLYDPALFEDLLVTVVLLLQRHPPGAARFLTAYQNRRFGGVFA